MSIHSNDVRKVAQLARIAIDDIDIPQLTKDFNKILQLADKLNQIPTNNIAPLSHPLDMTQRLRDDQVIKSDLIDKITSLAPQIESGLYLVPKVIE